MMKPTIKRVLEEYPEIEYVAIDIDENRETATDYSVMSVPTFILFDGNEQVSRFSGGMPKKEFIEKLGLSL
jgi:thioredoxin 1